jgi:hypothetical protein
MWLRAQVGQPTVAKCPDGNTVVQPLEWTSGHLQLQSSEVLAVKNDKK